MSKAYSITYEMGLSFSDIFKSSTISYTSKSRHTKNDIKVDQTFLLVNEYHHDMVINFSNYPDCFILISLFFSLNIIPRKNNLMLIVRLLIYKIQRSKFYSHRTECQSRVDINIQFLFSCW